MQFIPLLNCELKGEALVELLELWHCDVVYEYDRLYENTSDIYWASCHDEGVLFRFDDKQELKSIFIYAQGDDEYSPIDLKKTDVAVFDSIDAVSTHAKNAGLTTKTGTADFLGESRDWIKLIFNEYSIHYEFRNDELSLVTLSVQLLLPSTNRGIANRSTRSAQSCGFEVESRLFAPGYPERYVARIAEPEMPDLFWIAIIIMEAVFIITGAIWYFGAGPQVKEVDAKLDRILKHLGLDDDEPTPP